jgi:hypothetical protein
MKRNSLSIFLFQSASSNAVSNNASSAVAAATTSSISSPSLGLTSTKSTSNSANKSSGVVSGGSGGSSSGANSGNVVPNMPMVSQYIQTAGMPFYQQPVYSYEDIQMMQQRMPHVPGYYDINYQTPTSVTAGVRDASLGSVAYSTMSDGRFARTDNNSSPVSNVSVIVFVCEVGFVHSDCFLGS